MFKSKRHALAYLMGVYLSDGSVNSDQGRFVLKVKDEEFRDAVAEAMELVGAEFTLFERGPHLGTIDGVSFNSKRSYGLRERKPFKVGWWLESWFPDGRDHLPNIPDDLARDLVAGIMDGDGSIWIQKGTDQRHLAVCGRSGYLADLQRLFASYEVTMYYRPESGRCGQTINVKSFVTAGFYFRLSRKQGLFR